jgi:hypothetical protein
MKNEHDTVRPETEQRVPLQAVPVLRGPAGSAISGDTGVDCATSETSPIVVIGCGCGCGCGSNSA